MYTPTLSGSGTSILELGKLLIRLDIHHPPSWSLGGASHLVAAESLGMIQCCLGRLGAGTVHFDWPDAGVGLIDQRLQPVGLHITHTHTYIHMTHIHAYIHTYLHTYIHTYTYINIKIKKILKRNWCLQIKVVKSSFFNGPYTLTTFSFKYHIQKWPIHRRSSCFLFQIEF